MDVSNWGFGFSFKEYRKKTKREKKNDDATRRYFLVVDAPRASFVDDYIFQYVNMSTYRVTEHSRRGYVSIFEAFKKYLTAEVII
jgi:hypothetical protein